MPLKVSCAKCGGVLHAPDDAGGKKGKCPNCGNILPIPFDAPKVTDSMGGATGGLEGLPATTGVGNPIPRPTEPRGFGSTSALPTAGTGKSTAEKGFAGSGVALPNPFNPPEPARQPPPPRQVPQPAPFAASATPPGRKGWARTRRGLWWVRVGVFCYLIAGLAMAALAASGPLGLNFLEKDPGYLNINRMSFKSELLIWAGYVPVVLGVLAVVLGRFGTANVPASSGARGTAFWAAVFTLLALVGLVATGLMVGEQIRSGAPPEWMPTSDVLSGTEPDGKGTRAINTQERFKRYLDGTIMKSGEVPGFLSRFGLTMFALFGFLGAAWFNGAVGRIGANLQDRRTSSRATTVCWAGSLLISVFVFGWLAMALFSDSYMKDVIDSFFNLPAGTRAGIGAGVLGGISLVGFVLYVRMLNAARAAIAARIG